jgi:hypothetical protein
MAAPAAHLLLKEWNRCEGLGSGELRLGRGNCMPVRRRHAFDVTIGHVNLIESGSVF